MATYEDELKDLKEKNNELAQKVQYWKMTAAQRDDEKLALMKENNDLRLKLSRLRNTGGLQARKLDTALQAASEKAISHLVKASAEIAKSMDMAKEYMRDRQELDMQSPRWSSIGGTPTKEKSDRVHRVPPMVGGQSIIQPVISLRRTVLNTSNPRTTSRSPNHNHSLTERAVPMHMLQDVYIPLTRIDVSDLPNNNMETETETNNADDSAANLGLDDDNESDESDISVDDHEYDANKLQPVEEEPEVRPSLFPVRELPIRNLRLHINPRYEQEDRLWNIEHAKWREERQRLASQQAAQRDSQQDNQHASQQDSQQTSHQDNQQAGQQDTEQASQQDSPNTNQDSQKANQQDSQKANKRDSQRYSRGDPLEGPSWLLDETPPDPKNSTPKTRVTLEPDSTTELDDSVRKAADTSSPKLQDNTEDSSPLQTRAFSPTVRRRKRTSSPPPTPRPLHYSPRPASARRNSTSGRVLKVLVAKMRLDGSEGSPPSPPKRARSPPQSPLLAFDAPSPNGATDSRVIVYESRTTPPDNDITTESGTRTTSRRESHDSQQRSRGNSQEGCVTHRRRPSDDTARGRTTEHERRLNSQDGRESHRRGRASSAARDSDSAGDAAGEGRTRRARKAVTYKEKPLNRKLRR